VMKSKMASFAPAGRVARTSSTMSSAPFSRGNLTLPSTSSAPLRAHASVSIFFTDPYPISSM